MGLKRDRMDNLSLLQKSAAMQAKARQIINELKIVETWQEIGATINLVGSLKTGLIMNHRDIDFHIYTDPFYLKDSFSAITKLAENPAVKNISYTNLLNDKDQCLEWHVTYLSKEAEDWQLDMIHILKNSPYDGYFERVADRINAVLTDETRVAILRIKKAIPQEQKVMGIQIYQAVLAGGSRNYEDFCQWLNQNKDAGIIEWMP
jgi:hypothetical protein